MEEAGEPLFSALLSIVVMYVEIQTIDTARNETRIATFFHFSERLTIYYSLTPAAADVRGFFDPERAVSLRRLPCLLAVCGSQRGLPCPFCWIGPGIYR